MAIVHLIADYGPDDFGAFAEVNYALRRALGLNVPIIETRVAPLSDVHTGFWVQQHGLVGDPIPGTLLFVNTAPRFDRPQPCADNNLEPLVWGQLDNGVHVLAINAGHALSWVREQFTQLHLVEYDHGESNWRSRDAMPQIARAIATGELFSPEHHDPRLGQPRLGDALNPRDDAVIPPPPAGVGVFHIDPYGNIKLSLRQSQVSWPMGTQVAVKVYDRPAVTCEFRGKTFDIAQGGWVIAPGSSGHQNRFLEVWRRRTPGDNGGAAHAIGGVHPGSTVVVEPLG